MNFCLFVLHFLVFICGNEFLFSIVQRLLFIYKKNVLIYTKAGECILCEIPIVNAEESTNENKIKDVLYLDENISRFIFKNSHGKVSSLSGNSWVSRRSAWNKDISGVPIEQS